MYSMNNKPQFGRWLIAQVDSGQYEGVYWLDEQKTAFRIPWKHNSRKDCNDGDNMIFKQWAIVSGKIHENPNDKAKWKTNFRCALSNLNKQFKKVLDNSKDSVDPHKVYQVIVQHEYGIQEFQANQNCPVINDIYAANEVDLSPEDIGLLNADLLNLDLDPPQPDLQLWGGGYAQNNQVLAEDCNMAPPPAMEAVQPPVSHNNSPAAAVPTVQPHYQMSLLPPIHELDISIHYRRREVLRTTVSSPLGVQLHSQCDVSQLGCPGVAFPSTEGLVDQKQIRLTRRLLDSIQRGLLLQVDRRGVYGTRQGMCKVFASSSHPGEGPVLEEPRKLEQNTLELLFSFEKYKREWQEFKENKRGSPDYTIYLCFGEIYPDGKPLEKKLIVVKVVPVICRELIEHAHKEGASSLSSNASLQISHNSLQISHNSLFDLISSLGLPMQV
ncbi:interferon regulatory factor 7 [Engraulis encrasicolus]|uniref:interferon regulatory factor 7 n=1 Tax=Engraulis encrasicolus TaxID=184585 RepID=UPI002FD1640F